MASWESDNTQDIKFVNLAYGTLSNLEVVIVIEREGREWWRGRERGKEGNMRGNNFHYGLNRST